MSEYVYGNGDRVVSRNEFDPDYWHPRWESATYYHQDVLGSTSLMTNEHGHTVERYTYDAFGVQTDGSFERVNEIGYTGQRYDPTTNMYNYGFRDYTPSIARFTTVDPIRDGNNWYAYVNNDPVNFVDPLGLEEVFFSNSSTFVSTVPVESNPPIVGAFVVTVRTNVIVDTDSNTARVTAISTDSVYAQYPTSSVTTASVVVEGATFDSQVLRHDDSDSDVLSNGSVSLGSADLRLPPNRDNVSVSIETRTTYSVGDDAGNTFRGPQKVTVDVGGDRCKGSGY